MVGLLGHTTATSDLYIRKSEAAAVMSRVHVAMSEKNAAVFHFWN